MEAYLKQWDGEHITIGYDQPTGTWIIIAIHSTRLGPAAGGTRMKAYPTLSEAILDAQRLAAGMTYKWAAAGSAMGGGKAVLFTSPDLDQEDRTALLMRYGEIIQKLGGLFYTGPDLGTTVEDMNIIGRKAPDFVFGQSPEHGGAGDPAPFTALGVFSAIEVTARHIFSNASLEGRKVVIQGYGSVGRQLATMLLKAKVNVLFTDVDEEAIRHGRDDLGLPFITADEVYDVECDFFAPCAVGGILNEQTIPRLRCRAVVGGANNQLSAPEAGVRLRERGILYAPDFVANCGGALAITGIQKAGWSRDAAAEKVRESVRDNLDKIYKLSAQRGITTDQAACQLAESRLSRESD